MASTLNILQAIVRRDFTGANDAFAAVMQHKVNSALMDIKKTIVTEEPSFDAKSKTFNNITDTIKKLAKEEDEDPESVEEARSDYDGLDDTMKGLVKQSRDTVATSVKKDRSTMKDDPDGQHAYNKGYREVTKKNVKEDAFADAGWKKCARCGVTYHPSHTAMDNKESSKYCDDCADFRKQYPEQSKDKK
jgi:hypothetical protein